MKRAAVSVAAVLAIGGSLVYAYARYVRRSSMFFPDRFPAGFGDTAALPVQPEEKYFPSTDGVSLHAWLFRAAQPEAPLVIWCHGNAGNITGRAPVASNLAARGISVLLFDWRGYGKSSGSPSESGLYDDALAAYQFAVGTLRTAPRDIVIYGESLGGPYAAYVAHHRPARCVIIENSFPSLRELANALYSPIPVGWTAPLAMRTVTWLNEANLPVLLMHGKRDEVIPFQLAVSMYNQLHTPKEMLVSEAAGHSEIAAAERERYYITVTRFIADQRQR